MPGLETSLHTDMLRSGQKNRGLLERIKRAVHAFRENGGLYGLEWGDPECDPPLVYVKNHFLLEHLSTDATVLEIGPGGGRWTRYLLAAKKVYAVDYHQELLDELAKNFSRANLVPLKNNGTDFPNVPLASVDFAFSFGVFVHLDLDIVDSYLESLKTVMKPGASIVIQYPDQTKPLGRSNPTFAKNSPEQMRDHVKAHGYEILEEDVKTLWHSSIVRFALPASP